MSMLLSDYCSEINTRGIKKGKDKQYKLYQLNHSGQDCIRRGSSRLADGRTERVFHDDNKFQNTLKENQFCTMVDALKKKQTITSTAL